MTEYLKKIDSKSFQNDDLLYQNGLNYLVGLDEVGRGAMAGPIVVAAVILDKDKIPEEINDSKKISKKKREELFQLIMESAIEVKVDIVPVGVVDLENVYQATKNAMIRLVNSLETKYDYVLSDAMPLEFKGLSLIKGDQRSINIGAASIIAKVTRDRLMTELAKDYPDYGFEKHVGYCTKLHKDAIRNFGVIDGVHRLSFGPIKEITQKNIFDYL